MQVEAKLLHPGRKEIRTLPIGVGDVEGIVPVQPPEVAGILVLRPTVKKASWMPLL